MVCINTGNDSDVQVPFGVVKQKGVKRQLGETGGHVYFQIKIPFIRYWREALMGDDHFRFKTITTQWESTSESFISTHQ